MQRHRHIALHASGRLTARRTLYLRCISTAVLKQNDLLMIRQSLPNTFYQRIAEMTVHLLARILALEVNEVDIRQLGTSEPLR